MTTLISKIQSFQSPWLTEYIEQLNPITQQDFEELLIPEIKSSFSVEEAKSLVSIICDAYELEKPVDEKLKSYKIEIKEAVAATDCEDARLRKRALQQLCPCRVKRDVDVFWDRIFEMTKDPDAAVRYQALHNLCDGSPKNLEFRVIETVQEMQSDPCNKIRSAVSKILLSYRKHGKWNIL